MSLQQEQLPGCAASVWPIAIVGFGVDGPSSGTATIPPALPAFHDVVSGVSAGLSGISSQQNSIGR